MGRCPLFVFVATAVTSVERIRAIAERVARSRGLDDFRRFAGSLAKVVASEPVDGQTHFDGRIEGVDGEVVVMRLGRARLVRIPVSLVARARLEVEF